MATIPTPEQGKPILDFSAGTFDGNSNLIQSRNGATEHVSGDDVADYVNTSRIYNGLDTTAKTPVGAINEINAKDASDIPYDNTASGLTATDVNAAIDEAVEKAIDFYSSVAPNAGAHNSIYRGKNLGSSVTSEQYDEIDAGTFNDLFIGDYWVINGVNWRIAAFDYYFKTGDTICNTHHVTIVPDRHLYTHKMNSTNITTGGYVGSEMYTDGLEQAKTTIKGAFGEIHILQHRQYLVNSVNTSGRPNGASWYDSEVELMTSLNVFGSIIMANVPYFQTIDKTQYPLFALLPNAISNRSYYWLREIVSSTAFGSVNILGYADASMSTTSNGVRPAFSICKSN